MSRERAMKAWLTVVEAAEYSGLSRDTIYTACERRELRHARVGGRLTPPASGGSSATHASADAARSG
jgi:excisionase family DNA binding protein